MNGINTDPLLRQEGAAEYIDVPKRTLEDWRQKGRGPDFVKVGRLVRYRKSALDNWIEANTVTAGDAA